MGDRKESDKPGALGSKKCEPFRVRLRGFLLEKEVGVLQVADNSGAADEHRALNYFVVHYPAIYTRTAQAHAHNHSLTAVYVRPSTSSLGRKTVEVIFSYTDRNTDVTDKLFVRLDETEEFPFLVTKLSPYYDRPT